MYNHAYGQVVPYASILNQPPPNGKTILSILPAEIIQRILSFLLEQGSGIDITLRDRRPGRMSTFRSWFPGFHRRPLFNVCHDLTEQSIQFLFGNNKFYSGDATSFQDLPQAMGSEWVAKIRYLQMKNHFCHVTNPNRFWPRQIEFIESKMPELVHFQLGNNFAIDADAHPATTGNSRIKQEIRALIGLGAFIVLRHPSLSKIIWPGWSIQRPANRVVVNIILQADNICGRPNDQVLNSTAVRRYSWNELHDMNIENFFLSQEINTSENSEPGILLDADCKLIDRFGYLTPAKQRQLGHKRQPYTLSKLIHQAKVNKSQALREERDRALRQQRDAMSLDHLARLTLNKNSQSNDNGRRHGGRRADFHGGDHSRGESAAASTRRG